MLKRRMEQKNASNLPLENLERLLVSVSLPYQSLDIQKLPPLPELELELESVLEPNSVLTLQRLIQQQSSKSLTLLVSSRLDTLRVVHTMEKSSIRMALLLLEDMKLLEDLSKSMLPFRRASMLKSPLDLLQFRDLVLMSTVIILDLTFQELQIILFK